MKSLIKTAVILCVLSIVPPIVLAEALFLKDGNIVKGKIVKDTDLEVTIKVSGKDKRFARANVLRVLYDDSYEQKVYIFMNDKSVIEGYIVEETRDSHIYRTDLASPSEKTVRKDSIKFISKEKLSIYDIQKKTEKPKLIADRDKKFLNLIGLRLGAMYTMSDNSGFDLRQGDDIMLNIGLYYIDRFFEFNWDMYKGFGDTGGMLHQYVMTFLPFSMFSVDLGITFGYMEFDFRSLEGGENSAGVSMKYQSLLIGLYYRWGGWFRLGFDYSLVIGIDSQYRYDAGGGSFPEVGYGDAEMSFNCHTFIEVFVWTNMSFRLSYWYLGSTVYPDENAAGIPGSILLQNHCISLSIGYGLNMF